MTSPDDLRRTFKQIHPDTRYFDGPEYTEWLESRCIALESKNAEVEQERDGYKTACREKVDSLATLREEREKELRDAWLCGWADANTNDALYHKKEKEDLLDLVLESKKEKT